MFLFFIRYVRNRINHWCTVEPGNPNSLLFQWETRRRWNREIPTLGSTVPVGNSAKPRFPMERWTLGPLSPLNTNDGFSFSHLTRAKRLTSQNPGRFAPKPFPPLVVSPQRRFPPGRFPPSRFAPLVVSPPSRFAPMIFKIEYI